MKNLYQTLTGFEGSADAFEAFLNDLKLLPVFGNLYAVYPSSDKARQAVLYIVYAYSAASPLITSNTSWKACKERAAEKAKLNVEMFAELVNFEFKYRPKEKVLKGSDVGEIKDDGVEELQADGYAVEKIITTINAYLDAQNDKLLTHIARLRELYEQASLEAVRMRPDENGDIDWKQKSDCMTTASRLYKELEEWEAQRESRMAGLKEGVDELKKAGDKKIKALHPQIIG